MKKDKSKCEHDYQFDTAENTGCGRTSVFVFGTCQKCNRRVKAEATIRFDPVYQDIECEEV